MRNSFWRDPRLVLVFATALILITYGTRQSFGLYLRPISVDMGWGRETFSFAVALQSLVIGLSVPFVAAIADKWLGPIRVIIVAVCLYTVGLFLMAQASSAETMVLSVGVLAGFAASGCGLPMLLSVVGRVAPENRRSAWLGITAAGGTGGQFFLVPFNQAIISSFGWVNALFILACVVFTCVPMALVIANASGTALSAKKERQSLGQALHEARGHRSYWLLLLGFFTCGFQVQFVVMHLPAYLIDTKTGAAMGAAAIAVIGLFNMIGCWGAGRLGDIFHKKNLLCVLYLGRSSVLLIFFLVPPTQLTVMIFAATIGLLWLATVPLTSGIIASMFGTRYMATLYGIVFLSHQVGSFLSVWLGGRIFDMTGSYDPVWWAIIAAGAVAALLHFPISEAPVARLAEEQGA